MTLTFTVDLDILPLDLHTKSMSICLSTITDVKTPITLYLCNKNISKSQTSVVGATIYDLEGEEEMTLFFPQQPLPLEISFFQPFRVFWGSQRWDKFFSVDQKFLPHAKRGTRKKLVTSDHEQTAPPPGKK